MKKFGKLTRIVAGALCCVTILGTTAFAGTAMAGFSPTVGRLNGNGYTAFQTKVTTGQSPFVSLTHNGGYKVDVRCQSSSGTAGGWFKLGKGMATFLTCSTSHTKGCSERLHFSNNLFTCVDTQAQGSWKSN